MNTLGNKSLSSTIAAIINVAWWAEWIGSVIIIAVAIITAIVKKGFAVNIPVTFSTLSVSQVPSLNQNFPGGVLTANNGNLFIEVNAAWQNVALLLTAFVLFVAMVIMITYQLKVIFANFKQNQPFIELNISRIKNMAVILMAYAVFQWVVVIISNQILTSNLNWGAIKLTYGFNVSCVVAGAILLIVAQIFKLGVLLEEENSLTI